MKDIGRRLEEVKERKTLQQVLADCKIEVKGNSSQSKAIFLEILHNVKTLLRLLTTNEATNILTGIFKAGDVIDAIFSIYSHLKTLESTEVIVDVFLTLLKENLSEILKNSVRSSPDDDVSYERYADLVQIVVSTKDVLGNCALKLKLFDRKFSEWSQTVDNFTSLSIKDVIVFSIGEVKNSHDVNLKIMSFLLSKSRYLVFEEKQFLEHIIPWLYEKCCDDPIGQRVVERLLIDDSKGIRESESLLTHVVLLSKNIEMLKALLGFSIKRSKTVERVCCSRLIFQRVAPNHVPSILASYIFTSANEMFYTTLRKLIHIWGSTSSVRSCSLEQQKYMTRTILEFTKIMKDNSVGDDVYNSLFSEVISSIHEHLSSPDLCIRQSGMFFGQFFSSLLANKPEEPLLFDFEEDDWYFEMKKIVSPDDVPETIISENVVVIPNNFVEKYEILKKPVLDSDDEDDDFTGFDIPETETLFEKLKCGEEPEKKAVAPSYIRDCIDNLNEKEHYEVFEASFFALNDMIRRKALGLRDVAVNLLVKLVFLNDSFTTKDFELIRQKCIVSCLVVLPELAPGLCEVMFSKNCAFYHRYLIIESLICACKELSDASQSPSEPTMKNSQGRIDYKAIVDERIRAKTRYFTSRRPEVKTKINRFTAVATSFFYPLLRSDAGEHLQLKGKDASFLSRILHTVGEIIQLASLSPSILNMTSTLEQLISPLKYHEEAFVRASVMFCYYSIANSLSDELFISVFGEKAQVWLEWMILQSQNVDLSMQDREIAMTTSRFLVRKCQRADEQK